MRWNRTTFSGRSFSVLVSYQFAERTHVPQTLSPDVRLSLYHLSTPTRAQDFYEKIKSNHLEYIKLLIFPSVVVPVTITKWISIDWQIFAKRPTNNSVDDRVSRNTQKTLNVACHFKQRREEEEEEKTQVTNGRTSTAQLKGKKGGLRDVIVKVDINNGSIAPF